MRPDEFERAERALLHQDEEDELEYEDEEPERVMHLSEDEALSLGMVC